MAIAAEKSPAHPSSARFDDQPFEAAGAFENAPVPLWQEDYSRIRHYLLERAEEGIRDYAEFFFRHPEEVIALAEEVRVSFANREARALFQADERAGTKSGTGRVSNKASFELFRQVLLNLAEGVRNFSSMPTNLFVDGRVRQVVYRYSVMSQDHPGVLKLCVAAIDVSSEKRSGDVLRSLEEKYRMLLGFLDEAVILVDHRTRLVVEASGKAGEVTHTRSEDLVGMHLEELYTQDTVERYETLLRCESVQATRSFSGSVRNRFEGKIPVAIRTGFITVGDKKYLISLLNRQGNNGSAPEPEGHRNSSTVSTSEAVKDLSHRELEVLKLISSGLTTREIAERLQISRKTVETHRGRIMEKLDIHKAPELVRYALCKGLFN